MNKTKPKVVEETHRIESGSVQLGWVRFGSLCFVSFRFVSLVGYSLDGFEFDEIVLDQIHYWSRLSTATKVLGIENDLVEPLNQETILSSLVS